MLQALHSQIPSLLTSDPDLRMFGEGLEVRGLLRERLVSGKGRVGGVLAAGREGFSRLLDEGAVSVKGGDPTISYTLQAMGFWLVDDWGWLVADCEADGWLVGG